MPVAVPARRYPGGASIAVGKRRDGGAIGRGIPWGGTECQTQSERPKRGPRRSTRAPKVAVNLSGQGAATAGPMRRPGSGQQDRRGMGTNLAKWAGLVVLCLLLRPSPTSK